METAQKFDPRDFRQALGMFATGVTIVTTRAADGSPVGVTANSFNSVSIDPPLVLWSLAKNARSRDAFTTGQHWNVHILSQEQEALSNLFARAGEDKFGQQQLEQGVSDAPLLPDCSARFQCKTMFQYDGGDHIIFVGEVLQYDRSQRPPLLYVTGQYALASRKAQAVSTEAQADTAASLYSENLLGYLLGRAHYQFLGGIRALLNERGLSDADFFVLSLLSVRDAMAGADIAEHIAYTGIDVGAVLLQQLCDRDLLQKDEHAAYTLTASGRDSILHVIAAAKAEEADVLEQLGEAEAALLRNLLKQFIRATDPGLPKLWTASAPSSSS
ncbi:flavin reductase [Oryzisolibacter sp. LB2S]|uniref:flavin reductase n=1 Tax=Alicycliphilus soli TaxID=3228789 RepID=UPI00345968BE